MATKKIKDMQPGDKVRGVDGGWLTVERISPFSRSAKFINWSNRPQLSGAYANNDTVEVKE